MNTFTFDTGVVTFSLNGAYEISFNPTDSVFVTKIAEAFDKIGAIEEKYQAKFKAAAEKEVFSISRERDRETRQIIDEILGDGACDAVFGNMSVFALADGLPVWCNLFFAIMEQMDASVIKERKKTDSRISKYTAKYRR